MSTKRQYTEDEKAVALAYLAACGNELKTARDCKIPRTTLRRWINGEGVNEAVGAKASDKKSDMADACESLAWKLLAGMDNEDKISESPINQLSTAFGTVIDKMRLLRGESTNNVDVSDARDALHEKWAAFTAAAATEAVPGQPE